MSRPLVLCEVLEGRKLLSGLTPSQIQTAYGFNNISFNNGAVPANGAGQTIALIETYNDTTISQDLHNFDTAFNLPDPGNGWSLSVVGEDGGAPPLASAVGSEVLETALDVEWAHAIAPAANILVVEAQSFEDSDLFAAVTHAASSPGVSVVSTSYVRPEMSTDPSNNSVFSTPANHNGVTFVAASGDQGVATWPSTSPNVVGVGGTSLTLNPDNSYAGETVWNNNYGSSGGGGSQYQSKPSYQATAEKNKVRYSPDVAYDADPLSGFITYFGGNANPGVLGGTSAGAPQWAALFAIADQGRALNGLSPLDGPSQTLPMLYALYNTPLYNQAFHDITTGNNGTYNAVTGYDRATGLGSPQANVLVQYLAGNVAVPEPASLAIAVIAGAIFLRRPRRLTAEAREL
jgi:subtilase family serine protease